MLNYTQIIKQIGRGKDGARDLAEDEAHDLFAAILDGGVPDLELGGILIALRMKSESQAELRGFFKALEARLHRLDTPPGHVHPVLLPSYNGARHQANLTALLALLLQKFGIPVLIHGLLEGNGRISTASVLRALGLMPATSISKVNQQLRQNGLAFAPTSVLSPGLSNLLSMRYRLGVRNSGHSLAKMIDPFDGESLRVVSVSHPDYLEKMRTFFSDVQAEVQLLRGTEGEAFANPKRRPLIEALRYGRHEVLFEAEVGPIATLPNLPQAIDAETTAHWIKRVMSGHSPLPIPLVNQLACCLYGCGYAQDMNQAKAIVAVETGSLLVE